MYLNWGTDCCFFREQWAVSSGTGMAGACAGVFVLALLVSVMRSVVERYVEEHGEGRMLGGAGGTVLGMRMVCYLGTMLVMFLVMTMNGWVNLAVLAGMATAYLLHDSERDLRSSRLDFKRCPFECHN